MIGNKWYIILDGNVDIFIKGKLIGNNKVGDFFGESALQ
jgi:hypothetical protein